MARRDNRRANREAAKAMLETPPIDKTDLKAQQAEQLDFFKAADVGFDLGGDEDEDNNEDNNDDNNENNADENSEAETTKVTKVVEPSVENGDAEVEDDDNGGGDEGDDGDGEEVGDNAETSTEAGKPETPKPEAEKPAAPAPEAKKEEKKALASEPTTLSNEDAAKLFTEWRSQTEDLLATHHYRLDEKQVEELNANPAAYIPKAMARVYMDSVSAAFQQFTQYLPRMVSSVLQQREAMNASEKAFFDRWPDLIDHRDTVIRLGQSYRAANPSASLEDFVNEVGAQATVALRLAPANGNANANGNGVTKPTDSRKPFKPATELPAPTPPKRASDNPFEQLASEFTSEMEEDIGD